MIMLRCCRHRGVTLDLPQDIRELELGLYSVGVLTNRPLTFGIRTLADPISRKAVIRIALRSYVGRASAVT